MGLINDNVAVGKPEVAEAAVSAKKAKEQAKRDALNKMKEEARIAYFEAAFL